MVIDSKIAKDLDDVLATIQSNTNSSSLNTLSSGNLQNILNLEESYIISLCDKLQTDDFIEKSGSGDYFATGKGIGYSYTAILKKERNINRRGIAGLWATIIGVFFAIIFGIPKCSTGNKNNDSAKDSVYQNNYLQPNKDSIIQNDSNKKEKHPNLVQNKNIPKKTQPKNTETGEKIRDNISEKNININAPGINNFAPVYGSQQLNINTELKPEFSFNGESVSKDENGNYITKTWLDIAHNKNINNLYLEVHGEEILDFEIFQQISGMFETGHSGLRGDTLAFVNVPNPYKRFELKIITKKYPSLYIVYDYQ